MTEPTWITSAGALKHPKGKRMSPALIHILNHPTRRMILRELKEEGTELSPSAMSRGDKVALTTVAHHARYSCTLGVLRLSQAGGKLWKERFYLSNVAGNELVEEILSETEEHDAKLLTRNGRRAEPSRSFRMG